MAEHRIDLTPKWENLVPMYIDWIREGTQEQRTFARDEITRMAQILDIFMKHRKCGIMTCKCGQEFDLK